MIKKSDSQKPEMKSPRRHAPKAAPHHEYDDLFDAPLSLRQSERKRRRQRAHERRMVGAVLLVLAFVVFGFFVLQPLVSRLGRSKVASQSEENATPGGGVNVGGQQTEADSSKAGQTNGADGAQSAKPPKTADGEHDKKENGAAGTTPEDPDDWFAGTAMPHADTGDAVQHAKGTGTNHNRAASIYAYSVEDVNAAMFDGKELSPKRIAFLTFDDGVSTESTPLLLDELKRLGVPATFFSVGQTFTESATPLLKRMMAEGHALALHSYNHEYKELYPGRHADPDAILKQYDQSLQALQAASSTKIDARVWRYPGGHMSWKDMEPADEALASRGCRWIDWNTMVGDAEGRDAPTSTQGQVDRLWETWDAYGDPDVITILMHDRPDKALTRESLGAVVESIQEKGFSFGILE